MTTTATSTSTTLHTSLSANSSSAAIRNVPPTPRQSWTCNCCHISFDAGQAQREHMKGPWHVYNLKRRIASLPPISLSTFQDQIQPKPESVARKPKTQTPCVEETEPDDASPHQCLFCPQRFDHDSEQGLVDTLDHMSKTHGLFIPNQSLVSDLASLLGYLGTQVRLWHECLYCGTTRTCTQAIQAHMRDRGHCMLNLEREEELLGFWEAGSELGDGGVVRLPVRGADEVQLRSGRMVSARGVSQRRIRAERAGEGRLVLRGADARAGSSTSLSPSSGLAEKQGHRQLARRDEMGIQNIDPQQRHALVLAEKRSQVEEAVARRAGEWACARKANKQKFDQAHGPLAWAKGGLHNLLPR